MKPVATKLSSRPLVAAGSSTRMASFSVTPVTICCARLDACYAVREESPVVSVGF